MTEPGHFRLERHEDGWAVLVFDERDRKVNVFSSATMDELRERLEELAGSAPAGLVVASGKPGGFVAGANVDEIETIESAEEGEAKARRGQEVFLRLEQLPCPTVAAVNGVCLGGGLELALACDYIAVSQDERVRLGFPEVNLGILPGWGGTRRLPRRVGLQRALDLVLSGRTLNPRSALRSGLADTLLPAEDFNQRALGWARAKAARKRSPGRALSRSRGLLQRWTNLLLEKTPPGRRVLFSQVRRRVRSRTGGHYPAPVAAIEVIEKGLSLSDRDAYALEAKQLGRLVVSPESRNLVGIYRASEAQKKRSAYPAARGVEAAGVLGAGIMGGGIAQLLTTRKIRVRMKDVNREALASGFAQAWKVYHGRVRRRRMKRAEAYDRMSCLSGTLDYSGFGRVDFVIEAVVENLEVKRKVLAEVEEATGGRAIFATNTSSLPVTRIAEGAAHPENVVGMHFFNPVHRMPLVEIIRGGRTSDLALDTAAALAVRLGKIPVLVEDGPGFLVNRILTPYLREGMRLFEEGQRIERIDRIMKNFGMPMGPLELVDEVGVDVAHKAAGVMQEAFSERWPGGLETLESLLSAGRLGKKTGRGFYVHEGRKKFPDPELVPSSSASASAETSGGGDDDAGAVEIGKRLMIAMIVESAACLQEKVVAGPAVLDLAMVMGTGFPPFRGGPLRYADSLGLPRVEREARALAAKHGPGFEPPEILSRLARENGRFHD
jgi:3-hydroxyacyl-CoA dehydrogenase/enoyl-CoA hydratase/3-hydroxybutyryl-CoA epimerase